MGTLNPSTSVSAGLIATPWKAIKKSPIAVDTQQGSCELFSAKLNKSQTVMWRPHQALSRAIKTRSGVICVITTCYNVCRQYVLLLYHCD